VPPSRVSVQVGVPAAVVVKTALDVLIPAAGATVDF